MNNFKYISKLLSAISITAALNLTSYANDTLNMVITYDGQRYDYSAPAITLVVDGRVIEHLSMPPVILNDYTYVPVRAVFEEAGAQVHWDSLNSEVVIEYGADIVMLKIDNIIANINDNLVYMDVAPKIINDNTMVPVRFAAESLGFSVNWDESSKTVYIDSPENSIGDDYPVIEDRDTDIQADSNIEPNQGGSNVSMGLARDVSPQEIPDMSYPETVITGLITTLDQNVHTITASSEISKVDKFLLEDNRLVIDIYNAETGTEQSEYEISSPAVGKIRVAQNQMKPEKITRVVIELQGSVDYTVTIAEDRKSIFIGFERNKITDITFDSDFQADYIRITGVSQPSVHLYPLTGPDRIIADIPLTDLDVLMHQIQPGRFVTAVSAEQIDDNLARVIITVNDTVKYSVSGEGSTAVIKIEEPSYRNIRYDSSTSVITLNKGSSGLTAALLQHSDLHYNYQYILTMPGDYSSQFGYGIYMIGNEKIDSVEIDSSTGQTRIIINVNQVFAFDIEEDAERIYIKAVSPKEKYSKIVVIDAGHGGTDPGTVHNGLLEKDVTLDIANRVMALLNENYHTTGIKAYATRVDDVTVNLFDRAPFANPIADLFVSVHANSAYPNTTANGTETYYFPHSSDATAGITRKEVADIFQRNLIGSLGLNDRGVKQNSFVVLTNTTMPSVLCEIAFVSNEQDAAKLADPAFRQQTAQAIYDAILEVFNVYTPQR